MYLTAHRVTKSADGTTGVNSFQHKHREAIGVADWWGTMEARNIADHNPGNLISKDIQLPPGGNRVLSYLDVVCEDGTTPNSILTALLEYEQLVQSSQFFNRNGIVVMFSTVQGLAGQEELEYTALKDAIGRILHS